MAWLTTYIHAWTIDSETTETNTYRFTARFATSTETVRFGTAKIVTVTQNKHIGGMTYATAVSCAAAYLVANPTHTAIVELQDISGAYLVRAASETRTYTSDLDAEA